MILSLLLSLSLLLLIIVLTVLPGIDGCYHDLQRGTADISTLPLEYM